MSTILRVAGISDQLTGIVVTHRFAAGSKSDHEGVGLRVGNQVYRLRIKGGNAFQDPRLAALVGQTINGTGVLHGHTFIMDSWV